MFGGAIVRRAVVLIAAVLLLVGLAQAQSEADVMVEKFARDGDRTQPKKKEEARKAGDDAKAKKEAERKAAHARKVLEVRREAEAQRAAALARIKADKSGVPDEAAATTSAPPVADETAVTEEIRRLIQEAEAVRRRAEDTLAQEDGPAREGAAPLTRADGAVEPQRLEKQAEIARARTAEQSRLALQRAAESRQRIRQLARVRQIREARRAANQLAARLAQEEAQRHAQRLAQEQAAERQRLAQQAAAAEQARVAEAARIAAQQQAQRQAQEEAERHAQRLAQDQAERQHLAQQAAAAEQARVAEAARIAAQQQTQRQAQEEAQRHALRLEQQEAERRHQAQQADAAEQARVAEAAQRANQELAERQAEERARQRLAQEAAEQARTEEVRLALEASRKEAERRTAAEAEELDRRLAEAQSPAAATVRPDSSNATPAPAPFPGRTGLGGEPDWRVTVLMVMAPGTYGIRRGARVADPVLCTIDGCYISIGADRAAVFMPRRRALGMGNTLGARAGACRQSLSCVFRGVALDFPGALQPVDLHILKHDRRQPQRILSDSDCRLADGRLTCSQGIYAQDYAMWIVPERLATAAGPEALERALRDGLASSRSAQVEPGKVR